VPQVRYTYPVSNRPQSAGWARSWVRIALIAHGLEDYLDSALLIMSELITNAAIHATRSDIIKIVCELDAGILILGVIDHDPRLPVRFDVSEDDEHGRGLMLVDAIADEWGCRPCDGGKIVFGLLHLHVSQPSAVRPRAELLVFA